MIDKKKNNSPENNIKIRFLYFGPRETISLAEKHGKDKHVSLLLFLSVTFIRRQPFRSANFRSGQKAISFRLTGTIISVTRMYYLIVNGCEIREEVL